MNLTTLARRSGKTAGGLAATAVLLGALATTASAAAPVITSIAGATGPVSGGFGVVTLTGTNLDEVEKVWFGSTQATGFIAESATKLLVTAPAHAAGKVDVTFGAAAGSATSSTADDYTYTAGPIISGVTLAAGVTGGKKDTLEIAGTQLGGATLVLVGDTPVKVVKPKADAVRKEQTDTLLTVKAPNVKQGSVAVTVVTPQGVSTRDNSFGAAPVVSKLYVDGPAVQGVVTKVAVTRGSDAGGQVVNVSGSGFTGLTSFAFGKAVTKDFVVLSDTEAKVRVPAKAAGDVYVEAAPNTLKVLVTAVNPYSGATPKGTAFQYDALPTLSAASTTVSHATATTSTVDFTGAFLKGATVKFGDKPGKVDATKSTATLLKVTVPAGTAGKQVDVVVTTAAGSVTLPVKWTYSATAPTSPTPWPAPAAPASS